MNSKYDVDYFTRSWEAAKRLIDDGYTITVTAAPAGSGYDLMARITSRWGQAQDGPTVAVVKTADAVTAFPGLVDLVYGPKPDQS